jgi:ribonuclease-3
MEIRKCTLEEFEEKLKVKFKDSALLDMALTHSSYAHQKKGVKFNERLEFLGDSVLQLCITEYLFANLNSKSEGELTKIRALIVCENSLYEIGKKWNVGNYINMSKGEELTGGRQRVSILADCVEAIICSIYLDGGYYIVKDFIINNFKEVITKAIKNEIILDYKTKLQEELQQNGDVSIIYRLIKFEGPPHIRKFYTEVIIDSVIKGEGVGYSKKESEQNAAKEALVLIEGVH